MNTIILGLAFKTQRRIDSRYGFEIFKGKYEGDCWDIYSTAEIPSFILDALKFGATQISALYKYRSLTFPSTL